MSRDIYDQFRASQERLAIHQAEQEARRLREIHEAEEVRRLAEETRLRESTEKDFKQRAERQAKIIRAQEKIPPITPRLREILQAIKDHDSTIKSSKIKGVNFTSQLTELESGEFKAYKLLQLYWGESWSSPQSEPKTSKLRYRLINRFNGGVGRIFDGPAIEDFSLVTLLIDEAEISIFGSEKSSLTLDKFTKDESSIMPYLADAVSNPIRRYLRYSLNGNWYNTGGTGGYHLDLSLSPTDRNGEVWDGTEVDNIGRRSFSSVDQGELDILDA